MANEVAQKLGYTNREAVSGKHIAMNMSLTNAIRMGLVVNPKLVSCAYSLKTDGSLDKLKGKIDQIEDVQDRNEKLEEYEFLRRNVENAEGIPEILKRNVKKGGKYIVFLPIVDELEDEDGNVIGRKKGKDKIADYEKQIAEYFKGSDIIPNFHSMLGEYGDKENARRLEEFQNANTEKTEFMLVMNKANEGLHLDKLDGMIWLRPMDENSRILYLQQLGRVIYAEDPDNPTKDENRPVVIDLVNNTIKVNWENEITEQDDIQMLNLIVDWTERHDGTLPDINSSDKEETGYATVLKEIQNKYKEYLKNEFEGLNEKQIEEVQEIIRLGSQVDLWQIDLQDRIAKDGEIPRVGITYKNAGPFELVGILNDFVELENEVDEIKRVNSIERNEKIVILLEKLSNIGVDVSKIKNLDTIQTLIHRLNIQEEALITEGIKLDTRIGYYLSEIKYSYRGTGKGKQLNDNQVERLINLGINLEERDYNEELIVKLEKLSRLGVDVSQIQNLDTIKTIILRSNLEKDVIERDFDLEEKIGSKLAELKKNYRGKAKRKQLNEEQVKRLLKLGIILNKKDINEDLITKLETLKGIGINISDIKQHDTIRILAQKSHIKEEVMQELGLDLNYKIGSAVSTVKYRCIGTRKGKSPTEEQRKRLINLGINLEFSEKNANQKVIDMLEELKEIGIDVSKISQRDTVETLALKSEIDIEELRKKKIDLAYKIGTALNEVKRRYRGTAEGKKPNEEQILKFNELGINLETKSRTSKEIAEASISSLTNIEMSDGEDAALKELVERTKEGGLNLDEQS